MINIMFVCHGNICRSPLAEFVMKDLVNKKGLKNRFNIQSSATSYEEIGNPIYPPVIDVMKKHYIPFGEHYATHLNSEDYGKFDYFIIMDKNNLRNIKRIFKEDPQNKIHLLLEFTGENRDVDDPWYYGNFEKTYSDILTGCNALLEYLKDKTEYGQKG